MKFHLLIWNHSLSWKYESNRWYFHSDVNAALHLPPKHRRLQAQQGAARADRARRAAYCARFRCITQRCETFWSANRRGVAVHGCSQKDRFPVSNALVHDSRFLQVLHWNLFYWRICIQLQLWRNCPQTQREGIPGRMHNRKQPGWMLEIWIRLWSVYVPSQGNC